MGVKASPAGSVPEGGLGSDLGQVSQSLLADVDAFSLSANLYDLQRKKNIPMLLVHKYLGKILEHS